MKPEDISVVIVSWNGKECVRECLQSLDQQVCQQRLEIILVDNASSDGTPSLVREQFSHVHLIENGTNLGFAKANNIGLAVCRGKYICLINSDVNVSADCIRLLYEYMEENPGIGMLGPAMLGSDGATRRSCMRFPTLWNSLCYALGLDAALGRTSTFGGFLMRDFQHDQVREVEVLNGWFWMIRQEALAEVGGLDEDFFMYGEDIDWCKRFRQAGWRRVFYPLAGAIHYGGASSAAVPLRSYLDLQSARLRYWRKHQNAWSYPLFVIVLLVEQILRLFAGAALTLRNSARVNAGYKVRRSIATIRLLAGLGRA